MLLDRDALLDIGSRYKVKIDAKVSTLYSQNRLNKITFV